MESTLVVQFGVLAVLLLCSFFFSGTETAFFSMSSLERDALRRRAGPFLQRVLQKLFATPDEILITILTGNMIVNVLASSLAEIIGQRIFPAGADLFSIISMTLLLLLVGEMTPKSLAVRAPSSFARAASLPLYYVHRGLTPVRWVFNRISSSITSLYPSRVEQGRQRAATLILSAIKIGFKRGIINGSEEHLFRSFFAFQEKSADEIRIPRSQLKGIPETTTIPELLCLVERESITLTGSYIIAYQKDMDHLQGYLHLRDLLPYRYGLVEGEKLSSVLRPFHIVPESKDLTELMLEMRQTNSELALLVDEYGGTAGIVTFQHLIEEILGYFYPSEQEAVIQIGPDSYVLPGSLDLDQLEEMFGVQMEGESRTVAGLITERLGEIPEAGTRITVSDLELTIRKIARNRILEVEARRVGRI